MQSTQSFNYQHFTLCDLCYIFAPFAVKKAFEPYPGPDAGRVVLNMN
jgi:hypothetical protein